VAPYDDGATWNNTHTAALSAFSRPTFFPAIRIVKMSLADQKLIRLSVKVDLA
jgi:hypothetical protein